MPRPPTDPDRLVSQVVSNAAHEALRDVANQLVGLLWHHQQAATDPAEIETLQAERRAVRLRERTIRPGTDEVNAALEEWGARVRALRER